VFALMALMLACGVLEVVINNAQGWFTVVLIGALTIVDGTWALSLWRACTVARASGVGVVRVRKWAWFDRQTSPWSRPRPHRGSAYVCAAAKVGRPPCPASASHLSDLPALRPE
jgi:hypothetical protein